MILFKHLFFLKETNSENPVLCSQQMLWIAEKNKRNTVQFADEVNSVWPCWSLSRLRDTAMCCGHISVVEGSLIINLGRDVCDWCQGDFTQSHPVQCCLICFYNGHLCSYLSIRWLWMRANPLCVKSEFEKTFKSQRKIQSQRQSGARVTATYCKNRRELRVQSQLFFYIPVANAGIGINVAYIKRFERKSEHTLC